MRSTVRIEDFEDPRDESQYYNTPPDDGSLLQGPLTVEQPASFDVRSFATVDGSYGQ
jgi:hypothetical protein